MANPRACPISALQAQAESKNSPRSRGQSSLEALVSLAALLCALSILAFSAQRLSSGFSKSVRDSAEGISLAQASLLLDTAAGAGIPIEVAEGLGQVAFTGGSTVQSRPGGARDFLFHNVSLGAGGRAYVQKNAATPV